MKLITLTLKGNGDKVYANPARINFIYQMDDGCVVGFDGLGNYIKVLESAESVAKMVEGEQNG